MQAFDTLLLDFRVCAMTGAGVGELPEGTAVALEGGRIAWIGPASEIEEDSARELHRGGGSVLTPGLVDAHTHLVFGGDRVREFALRQRGATYEEIAREGGGILETVRATRAATADELRSTAAGRLARLASEGVTTVEIKSGYGLDRETELRMLEVAGSLGGPAVDVVTTFLGAHAVPPEFESRRDDYVALVADALVPEVARSGLAGAVDAFCERVAFSPEECARVFEAARGEGLAVRLHADQLSDGGGAALAARFGARSADHLEFTDDAGAAALAEAGTVAMLLPGAYHFLGGGRTPPVASFRAHGVSMAVATDANPGSSPLLSLLTAMNLAVLRLGLTPDEALVGVTRHAAAAVGLLEDRGTIEVGKRADLAWWDARDPVELTYWLGGAPLRRVYKNGVPRSPGDAAEAVSSAG